MSVSIDSALRGRGSREPGYVVRTEPASHEAVPRNEGSALDLAWVNALCINRSAVERRASSIPARRSIKQAWQAGWLLRAVTLMDLTTLSGDDTPGRVRRLCGKARQPVRPEILQALGMREIPIRVAAVCVHHPFIETALRALEGSGIPVAAVSAGFPSGLAPMKTRLGEIRESVDAGAAEIDIVVTRGHVLTGNWTTLWEEVRAFREAVGSAHLKVILGTGDLGTLTDVARASLVAMMAGADFIKTSTGKESVNATLPVGLVMARMIRSWNEMTGQIVGLKPAGGIRTAKHSLDWLAMIKDELGERWTRPELFRFGASSLLTDIERQLEHHVTGRYAAGYRQPMG